MKLKKLELCIYFPVIGRNNLKIVMSRNSNFFPFKVFILLPILLPGAAASPPRQLRTCA
jgi:hypothetical protein